MRLLHAILLLFTTVCPALAHLGSPYVSFEGDAGPHKVRVSIRVPDVVPGLAQINVRLLGPGPAKVGVLPVRWDAGRKGAPPPDIAQAVQGETNLYSTELWLMDMGAYSVFVDVESARGKGTAIVPLNSISTQRLSMPQWMGAAFLAAGVFLLFLLISLVGAALRESILPVQVAPDQKRVRRARTGMVIALVVTTAILGYGKKWWSAVDAEFRHNRLFKPLEVEASVAQTNGVTRLRLDTTSLQEEFRDHTPLVPDHGKIMHLFLVREPGLGAFAHLHPTRSGDHEFQTILPQLPVGTYALYADITHESGLTQTLQARLLLDQGSLQLPKLFDPDDSHWDESIQKRLTAPKPVIELPNGLHLVWHRPADIKSGREALLRFELLAPDGKPAAIEPYMGMWSHLILRSEDGTVFTHLHPSGSISMASQELFAGRERQKAPPRLAADVICGRPDRELTFPYTFPRAAKYRMWLQTKTGGRIVTGAFECKVF